MKNYELNCLISSTLKEEKIKKVTEKINSLIQDQEGVIVQSKKPVEKTTAYPVKDQKDVFLVTVNFSLNPEKVEKINQKLKNNKEVLRFFLLKKEEKTKRKHRKEKSIKEDASKEKISSQKETSSKKKEERQKDKLKEIDEKLDKILDN